MKILEFRAENIKNLKVVEIKPGDGAVILTGRNGAGKSAVLESIFIALTGKKMDRPIRDGEERAEINVDLGEYKVKRVYTAKGERLEVLSKDGSFKTPQTLLDGILGDLTFDPLKFANMDEGPRCELLAQLVGLDFFNLDNDRGFKYNERTMKNRELRSLESMLHDISAPVKEISRQEISMAEELAKVEALEAKDKAYNQYERQIQKILEYKAKCESDIEGKRKEIADLQTRISLVEGDIEILKANAQKAEKDAGQIAMPEKITEQRISDARANLRGVEQKNIAIRNAVKFDEASKNLEAARREVKKLDDDIEKIDAEKKLRIKEAQFPVEGLAITDEYVTFQGMPFSQLSTGQQIRVSTAVAMALNPKLKVIMVREGSLLDKEGLENIIDIAKEKDYQLWVERVSDEKGVGIYLEAGEIPGQQLTKEKRPLPPEG